MLEINWEWLHWKVWGLLKGMTSQNKAVVLAIFKTEEFCIEDSVLSGRITEEKQVSGRKNTFHKTQSIFPWTQEQ